MGANVSAHAKQCSAQLELHPNLWKPSQPPYHTKKAMPRMTTKTPATTKKPVANQQSKSASASGLTLVKGTKALVLADNKTRANVEAMRKAAKQFGVDVPKARGAKVDQELLGSLRIEIGKRLAKLPETDHVKCIKCGEIATEDTAFCPYCGDEGGLEEAEVPEAEEDEGEVEETEETEEEVEETEETEESDEDEAADEDADADDESVGIAAGAAAAANVSVALKGLANDLDAAIDRINDLKKNAVGLSYDIGLECRLIRDKQLFKARGYSSFKAFAEKELPFTRESALQLISIVEKHSRADYGVIGYSKLRVISAVSDSAVKDELMADARKGATTRELTERASGAVAGSPKKQNQVQPEKAERITLLGKIGARPKFMSFHNAETGEVLDTVGTFQTKGFVPSCYGELEISAGVFVRVALRTGANNELTGLTVRFVRPEAGA
jgi:hypothetical protein